MYRFCMVYMTAAEAGELKSNPPYGDTNLIDWPRQIIAQVENGPLSELEIVRFRLVASYGCLFGKEQHPALVSNICAIYLYGNSNIVEFSMVKFNQLRLLSTNPRKQGY